MVVILCFYLICVILVQLSSTLQVHSSIQSNASTVKLMRPKRDMGPLLPFQELVNDVYVDNSFKQEDNNTGDTNENCSLPNPCALLHVTNRKRAPSQKRSLSMVCHILWILHISFSASPYALYSNILQMLQEDNKYLELQEEYENLLIKFETQVFYFFFV